MTLSKLVESAAGGAMLFAGPSLRSLYFPHFATAFRPAEAARAASADVDEMAKPGVIPALARGAGGRPLPNALRGAVVTRERCVCRHECPGGPAYPNGSARSSYLLLHFHLMGW